MTMKLLIEVIPPGLLIDLFLEGDLVKAVPLQ